MFDEGSEVILVVVKLGEGFVMMEGDFLGGGVMVEGDMVKSEGKGVGWFYEDEVVMVEVREGDE